jgi:NosR/NirI family nitrous oxide reductase transcriptional regulator
MLVRCCLGRVIFFCLYGLAAILGLTAVVYGQEIPLPLTQVKPFFREADGLGEPRGSVPAVPLYAGEILIGYVFETNDIVRIPGYSGKPINLRVGINTQGKITGVQILEHHEPILKIGISEKALENFTKAYVGKSVTDRVLIGSGHRQGYSYVDGISGATVTAMVINEIIMRAARKIATAHHILGSPLLQASEQTSAPTLEAPRFEGAEPLWVQMWRQQVFQIIVLGMGLMFLTLILIFQDWLVHRPRLLFHVRTGFLLYTLFFIGWYTLAQLSVIQVLTFLKALFGDFRWDAFLIDPLIFILWAFVAVSLLLWGRGIFCGWLCPFGALQELTNDMAHSLKIRQFELPFMVPVWPNLAGQKEEYLAIQLRAFRGGERSNPLMSPMAAGLSDTDIENLAAYFSSLPACP